MYTLIVGLDAFDPNFFEQLVERGLVPNLARYVDGGKYARFAVTNPPQSEVSWTSIATGLDPGGHGIFDFVHRDPKTYTPFVSLLPTKSGLGGVQFVPPFSARTIFEQVVRQGYPATSLWWPATFPARPISPVCTLPGLGTPDIFGKLGVGTLFTNNIDLKNANWKTNVRELQSSQKGNFRGTLKGPIRKKRWGAEEIVLPLDLEIIDDINARMIVGGKVVDLILGEWSSIIELSFKIGPFIKVGALTRAILTHSQGEVRVYFLPLQLHPLNSPWPYATPPNFVKSTWKDCGPFLTIGWPQDTTGLEDGCISDEQFLKLCESICERRERILMYHLKHFQEGLLSSVFDSLDRVQHMFWRDRKDVIEKWYIQLDARVGRIEAYFKNRGSKLPRIIIVSDHGFTDFDYKVHLNRWLIDNGYLFSRETQDSGVLTEIDWTRSRVYAIGLNSLYLNLAGREGQGIVTVDQIEALLNQLRSDLLAWRAPDGKTIVQNVYFRSEVFSGSLIEYGPDLLVGFSPGYRASQQTGVGAWEKTAIEPNRDHWGADHCIDAKSVPGVLFSSDGLSNFPNPSYHIIPMLTIGEELKSGGGALPPSSDGEDKDIIEERLKSLG